MMGNPSWQTTPVRVFLNAIPWQGGLQPTVPRSIAQDWRSQTVRGFFSQLSWDAETSLVQGSSEAVLDLSYLMSVQTFFKGFAWQGRPAIGAVPKLSISPPKAPSLSLDDLSDLF